MRSQPYGDGNYTRIPSAAIITLVAIATVFGGFTIVGAPDAEATPVISLGPDVSMRYANDSDSYKCNTESGDQCVLYPRLGLVTGGVDGDPATTPNNDYFIPVGTPLATCTDSGDEAKGVSPTLTSVRNTINIEGDNIERDGQVVYQNSYIISSDLSVPPIYNGTTTIPLKQQYLNTTVTFTCTDSDGNVSWGRLSWCSHDITPCDRNYEETELPPPPRVHSIETYSDTKWVPLQNYTTVYTDAPKFRGSMPGTDSVRVTLSGIQVGDRTVTDTGSFSKSWSNAPLNQGGLYTLVVRGSSLYAESILTIPFYIVLQAPVKSANVTQVYNGTDWVPFSDGMTIPTDAPKFQGQTANIESIYITLNGTKVGGNVLGADGSFIKGWKHDALTNGTYILEIRERSDSSIMWNSTINVALPEPVKSASVTQVYNGTDWVPFSDGMTIPTDAPKFQGQTANIESIYITLNGTKVGGNVLGADGSFIKGWKHDALTNGTYILEIRETAMSAVLLSTTVQIGTGEQEPPQQEPPQQEPPQQDPPQQDPPQQDPPQTNSTNTQPPADPPTPPTPTKSADITLIHDGTDWVSFTDGMTISNDMPKFRGDTEGLGSIYITLDGTQVGGTTVSDTGSFWKSWKHDALNSGTYTVQIREISSSEVLLSVSITIR